MPPQESNLSHHATRPRSARAHRWIVLSILLVASFLRVAALDQYPLPIHQDELSDIYDGYSLATTGADRSGERWPVLIRGIGPGDYHPGAYAYLAAIPAYFAGFSVWAGRLPAALAGILTVWLVYLTTRRLFDDNIALIALLFAAFSPIHILYSRQAHQGVCLVPLFVILSVYLLVRCGTAPFVKGWRGVAGFAIAGLFIGLSTNVYAGQRVTAFLFAVAVLAVIAWTVGVRLRDPRRAVGLATAFSISAAIGAAPQLFVLATQPERFFARAGATVYPIECGFQWWGEHLLTNLALNLDPRYLFYSFGEYALLSVTRLNLASLPFLYIGLIAGIVLAIRQRNVALAWVPIGVLFSLTPALITEGNPSSMRSSGVWALYPIVCAMGVMFVARVCRALLRRGISDRGGQRFSLSRQTSDGSQKVRTIASPLTKGGLRGGAWSPKNLPRPLLVKEGGKKSNDLTGNGTSDAHNEQRESLLSLYETLGSLKISVPPVSGWSSQAHTSPVGSRRSLGSIATTMIAVLIVGAGTVDVTRYLSRPALHGRGAQHDLVRIGEWLNTHRSDYERIYVDAEGMFGYLYVAAFSGMTPHEFTEAPRKGTVKGLGWDEYSEFGRFRFASEQTARDQWTQSHSTGPWLVIDGDLNTVILSPPRDEVTSADRLPPPTP